MADNLPLPNYNYGPVGGIPAPNPTYPVQNGTTQAAGSSGGLVNKAAQIQSGVQNGINMANQLQQMGRAKQNYDESQAANKGAGSASALPPPQTQTQTGNGSTDFFHAIANSPGAQALMAGVHAIGHALTGGASPPSAAPPQGPPAPQGPPPPTAGIPPQGPPAPPQGLADGGPVTDEHGNEIHKSTWGELAQQAVKEVGGALFGSGAGARAADASRTATEGAAHQADIESKMRGGPIGGPAHHGGGFGVADAGIRGIQGFEAGGAIPPQGPPAPADVPMPPGTGTGNPGDIDPRALSPSERAGATQLVAKTPAEMAAPPEHQLAAVVEKIHQDMLDHTLNDQGVPNKDATNPNPQQALATPNVPAQGNQPSGVQAAQTAQVTQAAQQNPAAQSGTPETPSAHSISHEQWTQWDANIDHAVQLAAQAGRDPSQVRSALEANRNAWVQGHVLRNLSAANVALLNGDDKGVETALKNAYYYMPDGQDLKVQHDASGRLTYQDPIQPTRPVVGADGKPTGKMEPNMIPVDAAHIQMLGVAMLDPLQVQNTIMNVRTAQSQIQLRQAQAQAATDTGKGNFYRGLGIYKGGDARQQEVDANNYAKLGEGDKARALAAWWRSKVDAGATTDGKLDPTLARMGQQAGTEYDNIALGRQTIVPMQVPDPKHPGQQMANLDPNAGKPTRDTSQVPAALKNLTPEQHAALKATASDIALANRGNVSPARAADIVIRMQIQRHTMHPGPDGKPVNDVLIDKAQGTGHVWDKQSGTWINFKLHPNTAQNVKSGALPDPAEVMAAVSSGNGSGGGIPAPSEDPGAEATAPDMEPPPVQEG